MDKVLLHPAYFGPIVQYVVMVKAREIIFENEDNYQKQTYRNRMYIFDSNGKLLLNIPIKHKAALGLQPGSHQKYREVILENDFHWQKQHWRALKSSYQTSPFFEFYEDDFHPLYHKKFKYLLDFNYACFDVIRECLQFEKQVSKTSKYKLTPGIPDFRHLINAKTGISYTNARYPQVFEPKHSFLPNLSILDLLFNLGPQSMEYLETEAKDLQL